jgi:hypothetical protein
VRDSGTTGNFEIQVDGGALLHSKHNGEGHIDQAKLDSVLEVLKQLDAENDPLADE